MPEAVEGSSVSGNAAKQQQQQQRPQPEGHGSSVLPKAAIAMQHDLDLIQQQLGRP
jgi:hypothetical protein